MESKVFKVQVPTGTSIMAEVEDGLVKIVTTKDHVERIRVGISKTPTELKVGYALGRIVCRVAARELGEPVYWAAPEGLEHLVQEVPDDGAAMDEML